LNHADIADEHGTVGAERGEGYRAVRSRAVAPALDDQRHPYRQAGAELTAAQSVQPAQSAALYPGEKQSIVAVGAARTREIRRRRFQERVVPGRAALRQPGQAVHRLEKCPVSYFI